jgi:3-hydroxymyristoyl/3-hydroxydecanoyl-(acyl carrier protein) dehydratase
MVFHDVITDKELDAATVLERICIRPPYFALAGLRARGSMFEATARAETPIGHEAGPMSAAELGRHAAIAGTCCAAMTQTDSRRRYYLAQQAKCVFYPNKAGFGTPIQFQAKVLELTKRQVFTSIRAEANFHPVADFGIAYTILTAETFERLFGWRRQETPEASNPYLRLLPGDLAKAASWSKMVIANVPVSACAGHFENYPALPIAVLMGRLSELAGRTLAESPVPYRVRRGSIVAKDLVWAGECAEFMVERTESSPPYTTFNCKVVADDRVVATMTLLLEALSPNCHLMGKDA